MTAGRRITNFDAPFWRTMREAERQTIEFYLAEADGHIGNAAALMGLDSGWLYRRLKKLGIPTPLDARRGKTSKKGKKSKKDETKPEPEPLHLRLIAPSDLDAPTDPVPEKEDPSNAAEETSENDLDSGDTPRSTADPDPG